MTGTKASENRSTRQSSPPTTQPVRGIRQSHEHILERAATDANALSIADVQTLQRTIGNRATTRLMAPILQPKLKLGPAGDQYEQEADRIAKQVVSESQGAPVRRDDLKDEEVQAAPLAGRISSVQRTAMPRPLAAPKLQRDLDEIRTSATHGPEGGDVDGDVEKSIHSARGGGRPLDDGVRTSMESGFSADFSNVKIHTGTQSDALNRSLNARAFTVGSDIFFAKGEYTPGSSSGRELIAHELTHTVQQGAAAPVQRTGTANTTTAERLQRVLSPDSKSKKDWNNLVSGRTGAGVNGVVFATAQDGSQVVVKGLPEPPQRVMLAQELMEKVGVGTTKTKPVAAGSGLGAHILQKLEELGNSLTAQQNAHGANIVAKAQAWRGFQTLLLMEPANVKNLQELATQGPGLAAPQVPLQIGHRGGLPAQQMQADIHQHTTYWENLLDNQNLWQSFGKIFYVDQFLGNEDRFETMKIQNIFVDSDTGEAIAMDNDTMAADYISQVTSTDAVMNPNNPAVTVTNQTPDDYIRDVIGGGWMYQNSALQERMMGSLNEISGKSGELIQKVDQKVVQLLQTLLNGVQNGQSANDQAATAVLTNLLNGTNADHLKAAMRIGAAHARNMIRQMFQTSVKKQSFKGLFKRQQKNYKKGFDQKTDTLYNYLAMEIRYTYLELRAQGQDHNTALGNVQNQFRNDVQGMARTATTEVEMDQNTFVTSDRLVSIS